MLWKLLYLSVLLTFSDVKCAKILFACNVPSVSHQIVYQPIWKELSLRGHQVTVITPNPLHDPSLTNLTEIDMGFIYQYIDGFEFVTHWTLFAEMFSNTNLLHEAILNHPQVKAMLEDESVEFDVVLAEYIIPVTSIFAYRFKAPMIAIASLSLLTVGHEAVGNPVHPILHPDIMTTFGDAEDLTFLEKVDAVLYAVWCRWHYYYNILPKTDQFLRKYFGNDMPYYGDIEKNVSMVFLNTNPVLHNARPFAPGVVEMGKMHIKTKKPLPQDLKNFLDKANNGVIYFSLGSNVKSIHLSQEKRKIIMDTFAELPYQVLWKFENESLPGKPENVRIEKWLPQQDLLGHPNIKLFITQAGLQSTEEAIVNHVPLLAIPFLADQHANAKKIKKLGMGLHLDILTLSKDQFKEAIMEIITNPKYKQKVQEIDEFLEDQPMTGLEKAVWWTEYVIRHRGAPYFRSSAIDMPWYEYLLMDVIAFLAATVLLALYVLYKIVRYIWSSLSTYGSKIDKKCQSKRE